METATRAGTLVPARKAAGDRRSARLPTPPSSLRKPRVLVMGQTPPPYHGQALMIEALVTAQAQRLELFHVRLGFSRSMSSLGKVGVWKMLHLLGVLFRAARLRLRRGVRVLYFAPGGPHLVPVGRDLLLLVALRPFFRRTILHFHAAGVSDYLASRPRWFRALARWAYGRPAGAIQTSALNPADGAFFGARRVAVIPNGIADAAAAYPLARRSPEDPVRILFVGIVTETKGILILLEAARAMALRRSDFEVWVMGQFVSPDFERTARRTCAKNGLEDVVSFLGERVGDSKWDCFRHADILCFPSFYESESFGNVAVEGMMFGLPVVATRWRGIPDVVDDGNTGLLVPIRDPAALAGALERLMDNPELRQTLGRNGRQKYLNEYTIEKHLERMVEFLHAVATTEEAV